MDIPSRFRDVPRAPILIHVRVISAGPALLRIRSARRAGLTKIYSLSGNADSSILKLYVYRDSAALEFNKALYCPTVLLFPIVWVAPDEFNRCLFKNYLNLPIVLG